MSLTGFLRLVVTSLRDADVPYMLTGSLAGAYHGAPRATQDVDLVVDAPLEALLTVADQLRAKGLYVSDDAVREASSAHGMFNAVDPQSGWKADFIVRKDRPFSEAEFEARFEIRFHDLDLTVATAEDVIVAKLEWARLGASDRQISDVAEIIGVQGRQLDQSKIQTWVRDLGLEAEWQRAQAGADASSA